MRLVLLALIAFLLAAPGARAEKRTVCTITVNSADEKETFRKYLPRDGYQFVELVEKGRKDWLASACRRQISCDVLVVSGHFNAGETFYSDRLEVDEYLAIDELERASCSDSCPALFSRLKEVYLFGCESLNPDSTYYASAYGESGRDRMRRIFADVPVIYGFSSSAPVGPTAAMLLERYFRSGSDVFTGRVSPRLLSAFAKNSMIAVRGSGQPRAAPGERRDICQFYDERLSVGERLAFVHSLLGSDGPRASKYLPRIEKVLASLGEEERRAPAYVAAIETISRDRAARERYLRHARGVDGIAERARMIALARQLGWLDVAEERTELVALVNDVLARPAVGYAEVNQLCTLDRGEALKEAIKSVRMPPGGKPGAGHAAALACLGSEEAHAQVLEALFSSDERNVQVAQAYLRHRPIADQSELRGATRRIAAMTSTGAQVRALETLARMRITDREILDELTRSFSMAKSADVQRAIAEVFLRSDATALPRRELLGTLREHRVKPRGGREDLVDVLIRKLQVG
jgi:hypothetical protein